MNLRCCRNRNTGTIYLAAEDLIELLRDFAATEETDVRNRMDELIVNIRIGMDSVTKN